MFFREPGSERREREKYSFITSYMCSDWGLNLNFHYTERHSHHCTSPARTTQFWMICLLKIPIVLFITQSFCMQVLLPQKWLDFPLCSKMKWSRKARRFNPTLWQARMVIPNTACSWKGLQQADPTAPGILAGERALPHPQRSSPSWPERSSAWRPRFFGSLLGCGRWSGLPWRQRQGIGNQRVSIVNLTGRCPSPRSQHYKIEVFLPNGLFLPLPALGVTASAWAGSCEMTPVILQTMDSICALKETGQTVLIWSHFTFPFPPSTRVSVTVTAQRSLW